MHPSILYQSLYNGSPQWLLVAALFRWNKMPEGREEGSWDSVFHKPGSAIVYWLEPVVMTSCMCTLPRGLSGWKISGLFVFVAISVCGASVGRGSKERKKQADEAKLSGSVCCPQLVQVTLYGEGTWIIMNSCMASCMKKHEFIHVVLHKVSRLYKNCTMGVAGVASGALALNVFSKAQNILGL